MAPAKLFVPPYNKQFRVLMEISVERMHEITAKKKRIAETYATAIIHLAKRQALFPPSGVISISLPFLFVFFYNDN
jgi:hypothetical protein